MLERLDRFPDAYGQVEEIIRHYATAARRRENRRLLDIERRARGGDETARKELNEALSERARERGTTPQEELHRLLASGEAKPAQVTTTARRSVTDRMRERE